MGLQIHFGKTKILSNVVDRRGVNSKHEVEAEGQTATVLKPGESVSYLGRCLCFQEFEDRELDHRINRGVGKVRNV